VSGLLRLAEADRRRRRSNRPRKTTPLTPATAPTADPAITPPGGPLDFEGGVVDVGELLVENEVDVGVVAEYEAE
jgi:hypothetical protein